MECTTSQLAQYQVAEVELVYKSKIRAHQRPKVCKAAEAYQVFMQGWDMNKIELMEQFKALFVNRGNKVLGIYEISIGGVSETIIDLKLLFAAAIKICATAIIIAHNHPSSTLKPSKADITATRKVRNAGELFGIELLDHLIVTCEGYYSFAEEGLL